MHRTPVHSLHHHFSFVGISMHPHTVTESWFGSHFKELSAPLQQLHRAGGTLEGNVTFSYGKGLAGALGKRIAKRMGVSALPSTCPFRVEIEHTPTAMIWRRLFNDSVVCESIFEPSGSFDHGYWVEKTGAVQVELGVRLVDGAWHWDCRRVLVHGIVLASILRPVVMAHKRIENGAYCFSVEFRHPWLGSLFSYQGITALTVDS